MGVTKKQKREIKLEAKTERKINLRAIFRFDRLAIIVGFVVDCIAIISILFTVNSENGNIDFARFISPEFALGIWMIAAYTYFACLHRHWEKNQSEKEYKKTFSKFLVNDLLRHFRNPPVLFPLAVLLVILVAIVFSSGTLSGIFGVGLVISFFLFFFTQMIKEDVFGNAPVDAESKQLIDENWECLKNRIKMELSKAQWIDVYDLTDVAEVWDIDVSAMSYAFAKYAYENAGKIKFGSVHNRGGGELISGQDYVLINTEILDYDKYYFSS